MTVRTETEQVSSIAPPNELGLPPKKDAESSRGRHLAGIVFLSLALCSVANHCLAYWLGLPRNTSWTRAEAVYRRIGPQNGQQVFCAGSSLLVSGLSWPEVSESFGQGIENWTAAGSSPEIWEVLQQQPRNSNTTIVGVSAYDLNEMRLAPERARFVPLTQSVRDLWASRTRPELRHRILSQYGIMYIRNLYPTAGDADKVLVGLRSKAADLLGQQASLQQHEGVVIEKDGVLGVEDAMTSLRDWSSARVLRRLEALRAENHGSHEFFDGPKSRALRRVLLRAQQQGRVIVVVLPVSQYYADAFLDQASIAAFEEVLRDDMAVAPDASLVRLDRVPGISENEYFLDLVHLNSSGRRMVTPVFLKEENEGASKAKPHRSLAMHIEPAR
jgi:hypothetical protein